MLKVFSELYSFRFLSYMFIVRDLKVKYKQTVLGIIWLVLQPLLPVCIFTVVFGKFARLSSEGIPYIVFAFSGMVTWLFFSEVVNKGASSLVLDEGLLSKVYFPKIILPFSKLVSVSIDSFVTFALFLLFLFLYDIHISYRIIFLPLILLVLVSLSFSFAVLFSAVNVFFRDFRIILPFLMQIGMYASPIAYSSYIVPEKYYNFYIINPMVGIIESFRWVFFENIKIFPHYALSISIIFSFIIFGIGNLVFKKVEKAFLDVI